MPPEWGANALLHPSRRPVFGTPASAYADVAFVSDGLTLRGWLLRGASPKRGLIVYLHGIADNRRSGLGVAQRFGPKGYDVLVYDSRGHGASDGDTCTYGVYEAADLSRALDAVGARRAVLFGSSLGAAVALQAAARDPRVSGVIAQSSFCDLEAIARYRAPFIASRSEVDQALALAGARGRFQVAEASPRMAAARVHVPVLLLHGMDDRETPPDHSRQIFAALTGPRQLLLVPGAGHNDVLARESSWSAIERWLQALPEAMTAENRQSL
jgi:pimeloyl-ACP methyl ester carboxylesterase